MLVGTFTQIDLTTNESLTGEIQAGVFSGSAEAGMLQYTFHNGEEEIQSLLQWNENQLLIREEGRSMRMYLEFPVQETGEGYIQITAGTLLFQTKYHVFDCEVDKEHLQLIFSYELQDEQQQVLRQKMMIELSEVN